MITRWRAVAAACAVVTIPIVGCTSDADRFCDGLRDAASLDELADAIAARDVRGINASLEQLRAVQDVAPEEIFEDFRSLIDTLSDTVRVVTDTPDTADQSTPVDPSTLTEQLGKMTEPAQKVAAFAEENCGITLVS